MWVLPLLSIVVGGVVLEFDVDQSGRCITEDVVESVLFLAEIIPTASNLIEVSISDNATSESYYSNISNKFMKTAFTVPTSGFINVCINSAKSEIAPVQLTIATGAKAKDYSKIAKREHFDPVVKAVEKAETLLNNYFELQTQLLSREAITRTLVDKTYNRVFRFAVLVIAVLLSITGIVIFMLRNFFKSKKLI